jgi:UDP-glucose 4-epimerase
MSMSVVVTGGAGFIGANLVRHLTESAGVGRVVVVDDLSSGSAGNLAGLDVELRTGSILYSGLLDAALAGADAVVHLAAVPSVPRSVADPMTSHHANATGTLEVLQAVRRAGGPYLVLASSSSVYGANPTLPKSEDLRPAPLSPYAVSKLAAEAYALAFAHCYGLEVLPFRFFNVFGPLQAAGHAYAAVVPAFLDAALAGRPVPVHGDGEQSRDFTYVGTVARVLAEAVAGRVTSDVAVNLAFGSRTTLNDLLDRIEGLLGHPVPREHLPPREGDVRHSQADNARLRALFPDVAAVSLDEGLAATVDWFRSLPA